MKLFNSVKKPLIVLQSFITFLVLMNLPVEAAASGVRVNDLPFQIPNLTQVLSFVVKFFFALAGLIALLYLLLGGIAWITSGGSKEGVEKAREKIQAAIIGVILIVIVVAVLGAIEQLVFAGTVCFGLTCDLTIPQLLTPTGK